MQRNEYGKFVTKGEEPRAVRSLRLSDKTWLAIGEMAESLELTRADLLEQMFKSKPDSCPRITWVEQEFLPSNTPEKEKTLPRNTRQEEERERLLAEVAQLREENTLLMSKIQKLYAVKELQAVRDHVLSSLRLGKQAPKYKMVKSLLNFFIELLCDPVQQSH